MFSRMLPHGGTAPRAGHSRSARGRIIPHSLLTLCCATMLMLAAMARPARAWDQWASEVIAFSSQYSADGYSAEQTLDLPNVFQFGDNGGAWAPKFENGTTENITVGFPDPVYANGVTIRESDGNGFVTKVEVLDTSGVYHQVWAGTDPSQPGSVVDYKVTFAQTAYLVRGVRVSVNTNHDPDWEEIDAIRLHGQAPGDYQWASRVIAFSSEYDDAPNGYSSVQALGEPDVPEFGDDERAWTPVNRDGTIEYLTVGFSRPVYATGAGIRETSGSGFVTKIEALDTNGVYHQVWSGTDPTQPGRPRLLRVTWPQTPYAVDGLKITIDTNHTASNWEEIDAVYIMGASASTPAPVLASLSPATSFREAAEFTLTVNGSNFLGTSVVRWNGADRPTQYVSPSQLKATITTSDIAAPGTAQVTVFTPPPGGGVSNALPFTISTTLGQWASGVLAVTSQWGTSGLQYSAEKTLGPPDVGEYGDDGNAWAAGDRDVGLQSLTLLYQRAVYANGAMVREVVGNGFVRKVEVLDMDGAYHQVWAGTDTSQPGQIAEFQVSFPQTSYAVRGLRITVDTNHAVNQWEEIDAVQLQGVPVTTPVPAITKLGPNPALRASPAFTMVVTGTGFAPNSVVKWNGTDRVTTFVSPTTLTFRVASQDTASNGTVNVTVVTPAPGGGTSNAVVLTIGPARWGDVNNDNSTTMADVTAALRRAAGLEAAATMNGADVAPEYPGSAAGYGDGRISVADAVRIARYLQGL